MLSFEREVVVSLINPALDEHDRACVVRYVDESLQSMPEYLRAGVIAGSLVLATWVGVARPVSRAPLTERVERWRTSSLDPVRQYVRLLHSLVLLAENEPGFVTVATSPTAGAGAGAGDGDLGSP